MVLIIPGAQDRWMKEKLTAMMRLGASMRLRLGSKTRGRSEVGIWVGFRIEEKNQG